MKEPEDLHVSTDWQDDIQKYYDAYLEAAAHDDVTFDDLTIDDYFSYDGDAYG